MKDEQTIDLGWGKAAIMGFDESDGTQEFLLRTKYKSKIDQVIEFYGVPYCWKNDINKFMRYQVQPRHYSIVHDHFYEVLKSTWYGVEDFDYAKMQDDYNERNSGKPIGLDIKVNIEAFTKALPKEHQAWGGETTPESSQIIDQMAEMMAEMKELKKHILSANETNEQTNTTWESEDGESEQSESGQSWNWSANAETKPSTKKRKANSRGTKKPWK